MALLDMRTVIFGFILINLVNTVVVALLWLNYHTRYRGTTYWIAVYLMQTISLVLMLLRGLIPDWISIVVSNTLSVGSILLLLSGIEAFIGRKSSKTIYFLLLALFAAVHAWFTFVNPDLAIRTLNLSVVSLIFFIRCSWIAFSQERRNVLKLTNPIGIVFVLFGLTSVARIISFFINPPAVEDFFQSAGFDSMMVMLYQLLLILTTYSLVLMVSRHLLIDIENEKDRFAKAFHTSPYGILITRFSDGTILDANEGVQSISGFTLNEMAGKTTNDLNLWLNIESRNSFITELGEKGKVTKREFQLRNKKGDTITTLITSEIIDFNREKCIFSSVDDITERKIADNALKKSEARFRSYFDLSNAGIAITSPSKGWVEVNDKLCSILGFTRNELRTKTWYELTHPDDLDTDVVYFEKVMAGEIDGYTIDKRFINKSSEYIWTSLSVNCVRRADNSVDYFIALIYDISERKRTEAELLKSKEKAEESDRLKTAFIHNISHEIRTPMNAIVGFAMLLGDPSTDENTRHSFIEIINQSSNQLLMIVNDLIEISNIEAGIISARNDNVNLNIILNNLYKQFVIKTDKKGIGLKFENKYSNDIVIYSDGTKLVQILSNLIGNAIKFTYEGYVEFGYTIEGDSLNFFVKDTGIGIHKDEQKRIFERFYQVDSKITRIYDGTGLGLSISKAYAELLGGRIDLSSEPGKGSLFTYSMPFVKSEKSAEIEKTVTKEPVATGKKQRTILIAEDDNTNYYLAARMLQSMNFNLLRASDGAAAVRICESGAEIDLVLMDIKMPIMDGYTAMRVIRKIQPDLPIIATTAYAFDSDKVRAFECGCNDYIAKPFSMAGLKELINKYI